MTPPPPRAKQAIAAMNAIGFSSEVCKPVLKRLLKLHNCKYDYIEDNGYQVLIDSILEEQERAADGKKEKRVADDNCEQSRKRAISSHEVSVSPSKRNSENFSEFTTKKQKMESDADVQTNYIADYPSKMTRVEDGDEMPIPLSAIPPCQQNVDANDGLQHSLNQVSSLSRSKPVLEANDNAPLATQSTTPHFDVVSEKQVAADTSLGNGKASEFDTSRKTSSTLAFSDREDVKLLLSVNSSTVMPRLDTVIKAMEEKYLKCYMLSDPEFSLKKILRDMCQCVSELSPEMITSEQETAVKLSCDEESKDTQVKGKNDAEGKEIKGQKNMNCSSPSLQVRKEFTKPQHDQNDISKGTERVNISFVNECSNEEVPPPFYYIHKNIVYQRAYVNFSLARVGDEDCCFDCFGDCVSAPIPCLCARETGGEFAYTTDGLLRPSFLDGLSIYSKPQKHHFVYCQDCPVERSKKSSVSKKCKGHIARKFIKECWSKCGCSKQCTNRVVQHGISRRLQVFFTPEGKGWGLRTLEELPRGAFVCEYVGEILTNVELHDRTIQSMVNAKHTYPVLLDADWGSERQLKDDEALCLDTTICGNVARFVNHRCVDANMVEVPVEIETPDRHYYHFAFFTTRNVEPYEELTWDHGIDFNDVDRPIKAFKCCCGSKFCRDTKRSKVELAEPNKNCSEMPGSSLLPVPLTIVEEEATRPNIIYDDIMGSSSDTIHDEIQVTTSDHLPSSVESETTELNKRRSEVPKSTSDLIIASVEVEPDEQNETCNTNPGLASDILPSIEAEATEHDEMVDEVPRPSSVAGKKPTEPKSKSGDIGDSMSVLAFGTLATATVPSSGPAEETREIYSNTDPSKACTANLGLRTDSVSSTMVEEELNKSNGTCVETPGSMSCISTSTISFDRHVGSLMEAREIVVSNGRNVLPATENEIIASETVVDVVQEYVNPSSRPVEILDISMEGEKTACCPEIISTSLQTEEDVLSMMHLDAQICPAPSNNMFSVDETYSHANVGSSQVDEVRRSVSDDLPSSVVDKKTIEPNRKSGEICGLTTVPSSMPIEETSEIYSNTDPSIASTANLGLRTDSVPSSIVEEELNESNGMSILSFDSPIRSLIEAREIIASNETNVETPAIVLPATENETVAESVTIGMSRMTTVESIDPHGSCTENLEPESIPFSKENEIVASESVVDVVQEHADPSSCPVETEGENALSNNIASVHETENNAENCEELAIQCTLPSPPSSSEELINSSNLQSGNLHTQPVIMNENLHIGHSNDSSHPSILHPSPPLNESYVSGSSHQSLEHLPSSSSATLLPERTQTEENNTGTSTVSPGFRILPIASLIHPRALHPDPLQNELTLINKHIEMRTKMHEDKKLKIKLECEQEMDEVRKKYEVIFEEDERGFDKDMKALDTIYSKVVMNQIFAEQFGSKFMDRNQRPESSGFAHGRPLGPTPHIQHVQMAQASPTLPGSTLQFHHQMQIPQVRPTALGPPAPHLLHRFRPSSTLPFNSSPTMVRRNYPGTPNPGI